MTDAEFQEKMQELKQKAAEYISDKAEESKLKKRLESNNTSIKAIMEIIGADEVELEDGSKVCYGITKKESLNEDLLIKKLKEFAPDTQCIKTKEYVDMDILESEIYKGDLSDTAMGALDECRNVKEIPTLTIKKAKKGK